MRLRAGVHSQDTVCTATGTIIAPRAVVVNDSSNKQSHRDIPLDFPSGTTLRYVLTAAWWALLFAAAFEYALTARANLLVTAIGTLLALLGAGVRAWGMRALGRHFSGHIESWADHTLVETGPYRVIRHPAYAGIFLLAIGLPLVVNAYFSLLLSVVVIGLFMLRITWEEAFLLEHLPGYTAYRQRTSRIIPGFW